MKELIDGLTILYMYDTDPLLTTDKIYGEHFIAVTSRYFSSISSEHIKALKSLGWQPNANSKTEWQRSII